MFGTHQPARFWTAFDDDMVKLGVIWAAPGEAVQEANKRSWGDEWTDLQDGALDEHPLA